MTRGLEEGRSTYFPAMYSVSANTGVAWNIIAGIPIAKQIRTESPREVIAVPKSHHEQGTIVMALIRNWGVTCKRESGAGCDQE